MRGDLPATGVISDGSVFDLDEPRGEALRYLSLAVAALGWFLGLFDLLTNGSDPPNLLGFAGTVWLMVIAGVGWSLSRRSVAVGGTCLAGGVTLAIGVAVFRNPDTAAGATLALVVIAAAAIAGPRHGFAWGAVASLIVVVATERAGEPISGSAAVSCILIWGSAVVSWLGFRPVHVAAEWAWHSYQDTLRLSRELRIRQGELGQLSKSLNEACDRLERQNVVLERARAAAEEARRLKAEFAAAISHELRTPVNLVVGVSEMMMLGTDGSSDGRLSETHREDVEVIYRNACHISHLIDDILDLSQVDAHRMGLQKELVRVAEVVEQAVSALASQFERKGLYLRTDVPEALPPVVADPTRLRQVLVNLLSNATRFTDRGGVTVTARADEREVVFSVADTGVGVAPHDLPSIFEEFRQAGPEGRRHGHSGLGLAVSKRLIELHGGNMWATSVVGQGSTFHFSLPRADAVAATPVSTDLEVLSRAAGRGVPTLVVLGTDAHATRVIQRYLDDYRVVPAATVQEAVRLAQDGQLDALLVTSGQRWPGSSLPDLRGAPLAYCSVRTTRTLAREVGVAEYLVKPVAREQLQAALRRLRRRIRSVLVVEDDPEMRRMLVRMVRAGAPRREVREAANGAEALRLARECAPDVVLLDLLMPEMDGQAFLEAARAEERLRNLPVIVITAKGRESETVVADELTVTREGGLTVGELTRALRASLNALSGQHGRDNGNTDGHRWDG